MKSDKGMIEDQRNISVFDVGYETLHAASSLHPQASYRFTCPTTLKKKQNLFGIHQTVSTSTHKFRL